MEKKIQKKIERFIIEPNLTPIMGVTVTKETDIEDWTEDKKVHQIIKDLVLTTIVKDKFDRNGIEIEEDSKMTVKLKEGTRLIWTEAEGYILPKQRLLTRKDIKEELKFLDGIEGLE